MMRMSDAANRQNLAIVVSAWVVGLGIGLAGLASLVLFF
jgi:hypothetical protein